MCASDTHEKAASRSELIMNNVCRRSEMSSPKALLPYNLSLSHCPTTAKLAFTKRTILMDIQLLPFAYPTVPSHSLRMGIPLRKSISDIDNYAKRERLRVMLQ